MVEKGSIQDMINRVKALKKGLPTAIPSIIQKTSYEIEALNKEQLYNHGVERGVGNDIPIKITPSYSSKYYAQEKYYMNRRPGLGTPDLFLTGAFFKGFTVTVTKSKFTVDSVNSKSESIKKRYGERIFGLTNNNIKVYALGVFYTELQKYVSLTSGLTLR